MKAVSCVLLVALAVVVWWGAARPIGSPDFGWQVALGRWILENGSIPDTEPFTHTARGVPMVAHEWAGQAIYAAVVDRFGVTALRLGHALFASGAVLLLFAWLRRAGLGLGVALLTVVLWFGLAESRFQLRPHMWNVVLFVLAYGALFLARPRLSRPQLFGFFAGTVVWVNLHPGAMLLPAAAIVYAVAATFEQRVLGRPPAGPDLGEGRLQRLWALAGLLSIAILVSPHFTSLFGYVVESGRVNANLSLEWASIASERGLALRAPGWIVLFFGLSLATLAMACRRARVAGLAPIAVVLFVTALPYVSQRFLWTCFVPLAFVAANLPEWKRANGLAVAASAVAIAWFGMGLLDAPPLSRDFRTAKFPVEAMTFLEEAQLEGRLFNSNKWGGYVLFRTGEGYPVFVDGRWITIGQRIVRDSHAIANRTPGHVELLDDYAIEILLVHRGWMTDAIRARGGWIPVFENFNSGVYLRPGPALRRVHPGSGRLLPRWGWLAAQWNRRRRPDHRPGHLRL